MISGGNLGNQCYRDYFYGKDKVVEKALGGIEDSAAIFISRMILNGGSVPARLSAEHLILAHFLVLQASRTGYEAEAQAEAAEKMFDILYGDQDEKPEWQLARFLSCTTSRSNCCATKRMSFSSPPTTRLNADPANVLRGERASSEIDVLDWLGGKRSAIVTEDVLGLGHYGKTLTVLSSESIGQEDDDGEAEEDTFDRWDAPRFKR